MARATSVVSVPIPIELFVEIVDFLREQKDKRDPIEAIRDAIDYWMENASWKPELLSIRDKGFRWKQLFLPHSTLVRMRYQGEFHYAKVEGDELRYDNKSVSPSEFVHRVTGTARNAWRDLEVRRPTDEEWMPATGLRSEIADSNPK